MGFNLFHRLVERAVKGAVLRVFHLNDTAGFLRRDDKQDIGIAVAGLGVGFYDPASLCP